MYRIFTVILVLFVSQSIIAQSPQRPNIIASYLINGNYQLETINSIVDKLTFPRDLDFHPNGELWLVNQDYVNSGGSTVTYYNPGKPNQQSLWRRDGNAWHFMSLPSGIAFSQNGNFATSTSVFDANHNGGAPFTGPALWSSDSLVYAQPSGGNGSHLDMLHESPNCMGIAAEKDNAFWVFDAYNNDIVYYDFQADHGPGNNDHSDGIVRRYPEVSVNWINQNTSSHLVRDNGNWLYIVDGGNKRILRMDVTTGSPTSTPTFGPHEQIAEYKNYTGVVWETVVDAGLTEPVGIDVIDNRMIVSDKSNGDIIIYDISSMPAVELGRIATGKAGIQGLVIGPEGRIWFVDTDDHKLFKIEPQQILGMEPLPHSTLSVYPNPGSGQFFIENAEGMKAEVTDISGRIITLTTIENKSLDLTHLPKGLYFISVINKGRAKVIIE